MTTKLLLKSASGIAPVPSLDVDDVYSTYLYRGTGSNITINNGIDLSTQGGLVWVKNRTDTASNSLTDTVRGAGKTLYSDGTDQEVTEASGKGITAFNANGFTVGTTKTNYNVSNKDFASFSFREAPRFFSIVTYTGNGSHPRTLSHNLQSDVGMMIIKPRDFTDNWFVWHRGMTNPQISYLRLQDNTAATTSSSTIWSSNNPTSSEFTVGDNNCNMNNVNYVAYFFAHNDSDGGFGPSADQDIIKCGSYTGTGANTINTINLGFEPQWVLFRRYESGDNWYILDSMRGFVDLDTGDKTIVPNETNAEQDINTNFFGSRGPRLTATGFEFKNTATVNGSTGKYVYMAIRRGPLAVPTSASDVFAVDQGDTTTTDPQHVSNFVVDMAFNRDVNSTSNNRLGARLIQGKELYTNTSSAVQGQSNFMFDYNTGWYDLQQNSNFYAWMWKRAPNFFDIVTYEGTGNARNINHNLGVAPEMIWIKQINVTEQWIVYHKDMGNNKYMVLSSVNGPVTSSSHFNNTTPSTTTFTIGTDSDVNETSGDYISFHFSTLAGISKVGSYTGNGSTSGLTIDCGFSNGAKFVLIKAYGDNSNRMHWYVFDSVRGITFGNDYWIELDTTEAQQSVSTAVKPDNSGFKVVGATTAGHATVNKVGETYIFYAVAA